MPAYVVEQIELTERHQQRYQRNGPEAKQGNEDEHEVGPRRVGHWSLRPRRTVPSGVGERGVDAIAYQIGYEER